MSAADPGKNVSFAWLTYLMVDEQKETVVLVEAFVGGRGHFDVKLDLLTRAVV